MVISFYSAFVTILFCLWFSLRRPKIAHNLTSYKTMVVLGSGASLGLNFGNLPLLSFLYPFEAPLGSLPLALCH